MRETFCKNTNHAGREGEKKMTFHGETYNPLVDGERLTTQLMRIFELMKDGKFRTLTEISAITHDPITSIGSRLRGFREPKFGSHTVIRRFKGDRKNGLWEYRLILNVQLHRVGESQNV